MNRKLLGAGTGLVVLLGGLAAAAPASAAQSTMEFTCDGSTITLRTNDNRSSDMGGWAAAQVVGDGTLIPTSFSFSAYDETTDAALFSFTSQKGRGNANKMQQTVDCTQTQTATLADLLEPGDELPPGAALTDTVTVTFDATAVPKP